MDQGSLVAEGSIFTDIAYDISIRKLIDEGFLSPITSVSKEAVDLTGVKTSGYDYNQTDLESVFNADTLVSTHCEAIKRLTQDRKHILIFCCGIIHAGKVVKGLEAVGITADLVTGEMCAWERDSKIDAFKDGRVRALCNVGVLTTGFNFKGIDCVVLLRATKSASLYIQMVGRGTRKEEGKVDCRVLDFGGNIDRHGPIDLVSIKSKREKKGTLEVQPHKKCPICGCVVPIRVDTCPSCEYKYPDATKNLVVEASETPILVMPEEVYVTATYYKRHQKAGKPDSFKIEYQAGNLQRYYDFLCFEHEGYARTMARNKWWQRGGSNPPPNTVSEALDRAKELNPVVALRVIKRDKFPEILQVIYGAENTEPKMLKLEPVTDDINF